MSLPTKITPTFEVAIQDFSGNDAALPLITLALWAIALRSEAQGFQVSPEPVEPIVRKFLGTPEDYPLAALSEHVTASHNHIKDQLGFSGLI